MLLTINKLWRWIVNEHLLDVQFGKGKTTIFRQVNETQQLMFWFIKNQLTAIHFQLDVSLLSWLVGRISFILGVANPQCCCFCTSHSMWPPCLHTVWSTCPYTPGLEQADLLLNTEPLKEQSNWANTAVYQTCNDSCSRCVVLVAVAGGSPSAVCCPADPISSQAMHIILVLYVYLSDMLLYSFWSPKWRLDSIPLHFCREATHMFRNCKLHFCHHGILIHVHNKVPVSLYSA